MSDKANKALEGRHGKRVGTYQVTSYITVGTGLSGPYGSTVIDGRIAKAANGRILYIAATVKSAIDESVCEIKMTLDEAMRNEIVENAYQEVDSYNYRDPRGGVDYLGRTTRNRSLRMTTPRD